MWPDILGFRDPDWQNGLEVWQLDCACFNCHLNSLSKNDGKSQIDIDNSVFHFCFLAEALCSEEAREFHAWQAGKLANAGVDLLLAATLPSLREAKGLAMAGTGLPYIVSFVVRPEGTLLDGTLLREAVSGIDAGVQPQPLAYMINCSHASFFKSALLHASNSSEQVRQRMTGLLANTAALTPEELDDSNALVSEDPEVFGRSVAELHRELGMKIVGGCCGTDNRHIRSLASNLVE